MRKGRVKKPSLEKIYRAKLSVCTLWVKLDKLVLPDEFKPELDALKQNLWSGHDALKRAARAVEEAQAPATQQTKK